MLQAGHYHYPHFIEEPERQPETMISSFVTGSSVEEGAMNHPMTCASGRAGVSKPRREGSDGSGRWLRTLAFVNRTLESWYGL